MATKPPLALALAVAALGAVFVPSALAAGDAGPLAAAAERGDAAELTALLGKGDPNARDGSGRPLLLLAARSGRASVVAALLHAGARADRGDAGGWTALHEAAARGDDASLRLLLDAGASVDLRARAGGTPLDVAESSGLAGIARLLREAGARGSGRSIGDVVCVRPWAGAGYCGRVLGRDATRFDLRLMALVGCERGCAPEAACSGGKPVGSGGLGPGDRLWVPASCLTHTGLK
jgi:hypothetical protein